MTQRALESPFPSEGTNQVDALLMLRVRIVCRPTRDPSRTGLLLRASQAFEGLRRLQTVVRKTQAIGNSSGKPPPQGLVIRIPNARRSVSPFAPKKLRGESLFGGNFQQCIFPGFPGLPGKSRFPASPQKTPGRHPTPDKAVRPPQPHSAASNPITISPSNSALPHFCPPMGTSRNRLSKSLVPRPPA